MSSADGMGLSYAQTVLGLGNSKTVLQEPLTSSVFAIIREDRPPPAEILVGNTTGFHLSSCQLTKRFILFFILTAYSFSLIYMADGKDKCSSSSWMPIPSLLFVWLMKRFILFFILAAHSFSLTCLSGEMISASLHLSCLCHLFDA